MTTANLFTHSATAQSQAGTHQTEGQALYQQASQSPQPEAVVKRQFEQRNRDQQTQLANQFIESAGREGINNLAATPDGQHALAVVYDHADDESRAFMQKMHEEQGATAVDYTNRDAELNKAMESGMGSLQSAASVSNNTQQLIELINARSEEMGLSINLSDQASQAEIDQANETINAVIKYDQKTFGTVLTTDKVKLLNEYIQQQESDLPPIAYVGGDEQKYAPIKPIIGKINQLKSESKNEDGFFDRLNQNINKSAAFKPLFQSQSTGQPVVDVLTSTSDAILNLPTTATNLLLVAANSPAIVISAATGDPLEKTEMDLIGAAMSVSPLAEGVAELSTIRRAIGLRAVNTTNLASNRLSEGGKKVTDFLQKSFSERLKRDGESPIQTERIVDQVELKIDSGSSQVTSSEGVGSRSAASLEAENGVTMLDGVSGPNNRVPLAGDLDFVGPTQVGQSSRLVPGGGLQAHEGVMSVFNQPAHTIQRHVGQSLTDLQQRLASNTRLRQVSTFNDRSQAESILSKVINLKQTEINQFMAQPVSIVARDNRLVLNVPLNENTGSILVRGNTNFVDGSGVRLIIDKVQNQAGLPYAIVTGFPTK